MTDLTAEERQRFQCDVLLGFPVQIETANRLLARLDALEQERMALDPAVTDEARWLEERNAGAESLAETIMADDYRGEMAMGPCADLLNEWRRLKRAEARCAALGRVLGRLKITVEMMGEVSERSLARLLREEGLG